ncbi:hypothetical protein HGRIS_011852 [Hohenbuehelia grisea]|uniref:Transmembrane protein n=1 Tax=Hohenbuehelia grisea TaxID=104357 RepID=A0ABR3JY33_9AGAR
MKSRSLEVDSHSRPSKSPRPNAQNMSKDSWIFVRPPNGDSESPVVRPAADMNESQQWERVDRDIPTTTQGKLQPISSAVVVSARLISRIAVYVLGIVVPALEMLCTPLTYIVFVCMLRIVLAWASASAFTSLTGIISLAISPVHFALSPICGLPFFSATVFCLSYQRSPRESFPAPPQAADYLALVDVQTAALEELLRGATLTASDSIDLRLAEITTRDLVSIVRYSTLHYKEDLIEHLVGFADACKKVLRGLQSMRSKVSGVVDSVLTVNEYALHSIEQALQKRWSLAKLFWPSDTAAATIATEAIVAATFHEAMAVLTSQLHGMLAHLNHSLAELDHLESHLPALHEIIAHENTTLSEERTDILANPLTFFGAHRRLLNKYATHLELLNQLDLWSMLVRSRVGNALQTVISLSATVDDLKVRTSLPLVGPPISIAVHLRSLQNGLEKLRQGHSFHQVEQQEDHHRG